MRTHKCLNHFANKKPFLAYLNFVKNVSLTQGCGIGLFATGSFKRIQI